MNGVLYLTTEELAERIRMKPQTIRKWRRVGGGPPFRRMGKNRVLYAVKDVDAWLAAIPTHANTSMESMANAACG